MIPSPRRIIVVLALVALGLAVIAAGSGGPRSAMARAGDGLVAIVALATGDTGSASVKCCKTSSPRAHAEAPGVLAAALGADDPRVAARFAPPDAALRRADRTPLPELDPPQPGSPA